MASAEELLELKRRLMAGEISADDYRRAKIAAYKGGAPTSHSDRLISPSDSGRVERVDANLPPKRESALDATRRVLAEKEASRRRSEDPAAAAIAAKRERLAAKDSQRRQAVSATGGANPAAAAIEAKRNKMAAAAAKRQVAVDLEPEPQGTHLFVIVRPRGMRKTERLAREAADAMRKEGLRLADLSAQEPVEPEASVGGPPNEESAEDYFERRLREARDRLRGD